MKHEISRIVWFLGIVVSALIIGAGFVIEGYASFVKVLGFVVLILSYIQALIFCRCPYCSHSFMTISGVGSIKLTIEMPKYCPKCGKEVN